MSKLHFNSKRAETRQFSILTAKSKFFVRRCIFEALTAPKFWRVYRAVSPIIKYEMSAFTGKKIINFEAKIVSRRENENQRKNELFRKKKSILDEIWKSTKKCQKIIPRVAFQKIERKRKHHLRLRCQLRLRLVNVVTKGGPYEAYYFKRALNLVFLTFFIFDFL